MTTSDTRDTAKDEGLLKSVAESIGSTLGTLAAKANAATHAFTSKTPARKRHVSRKRKVARSAGAAQKKTARNSAKRRVKSNAKRSKPAKRTRARRS